MLRVAAIILAAVAALSVQVSAEERAVELLAKAETALAAAKSPKQRLAALGQAAQAQEAALRALRVDTLAMDGRSRAVKGQIAEQERSLQAVLWALERLERTPRTATLAHPGGPVAAARAGMALTAFTPALEEEAARLRVALDALRSLDRRRAVATAEARASLNALQDLRTEIAALMDNERRRRTLPEDMVARMEAQAAALSQSSGNLQALEAALPPSEGAGASGAPSIRAAKGKLTQPFEGVLQQPFGQSGEGARLSVAPFAQIYAPWPSVVRFSGPFGDLGGVVILEPEPGLLMVFGGLGETPRATGEAVLQGEPIGAMGGPQPKAEEFLIASSDINADESVQTLYMEIRENGEPVDPASWFALVTEGDLR
ncbi:MAG: peptidoglycan DD-metalloendopeptidase family protein [Pseudomonadota bacterium]